MTPEEKTEVRHQAAITVMQNLWEAAAQLAVFAAADRDQCRAEAKEQIETLTKRVAELEAEKPPKTD